jgi:hypothetical protein
MAVESNVMTGVDEPKPSAATNQVQEEKNRVGPVGIVLITIYFILFAVLLLYALVKLWPAGGAAPASSSVTLFRWTFSISDEVRLFLIVAMSGALGSLVHALRSFYWYVGNRELVRSWVAKYVLLPFVGSSLGLVFYLVIRGGFFSPQASLQQTSPFGFAALAGLVGMFSEQAVLKLKEVADTLLKEPPVGKDAKPQTDGEPTPEPNPQPPG